MCVCGSLSLSLNYMQIVYFWLKMIVASYEIMNYMQCINSITICSNFYIPLGPVHKNVFKLQRLSNRICKVRLTPVTHLMKQCHY